MAGWTSPEEKKVLDAYFNGTVLTPPDPMHLALFTADPGDSGTVANEVSYTGYARVSVTTTDWNTGVEGDPSYVDNASVFDFGVKTGGADETASFWALCDGPSAGNVVFSGLITAPLLIQDGVQPQFPAGNLQARLD